jgi:hypothetical protein
MGLSLAVTVNRSVHKKDHKILKLERALKIKFNPLPFCVEETQAQGNRWTSPSAYSKLLAELRR